MKYFALTFASLACTAFAAQGDPLSAFESSLQECRAQVAQWPNERVQPFGSGGWVHQFITPAKISYDVKKTDSLVSPFSAIAIVEWTEQIAQRQSREEAEAADATGASTVHQRFVIRYAYRQGDWRATGGAADPTYTLSGNARPEPRIPPVQLTVDTLAKISSLSKCIF